MVRRGNRVQGFRKALQPFLLLAPCLLFLAAFYIYPLGGLFGQSLGRSGNIFGSYESFFSSRANVSILWGTIQLSGIVTLICLAVGYPTAYFIYRTRRLRYVLLTLVIFPYLTSFLVRTYGWTVILRPNGILNEVLLDWGLISRPLNILYTPISVYIGMAHVMLPLMILPIYAVMQGIDVRLVRAARSLGADPLRAHFSVFFPLALPGVASGTLLVFLISLGFYITPVLLGGLRDVTLSMFIEVQMLQLINWRMAATAAVILLGATAMAIIVPLICLRLVRILRVLADRHRRTEEVGSAGNGGGKLIYSGWEAEEPGPFGKAIRLVYVRLFVELCRRVPALVGVATMIFLILPSVLVAQISFNAAPQLGYPPTAYSLRWYESFFRNQAWTDSVLISFQIAALTTAISVALGGLAAYGIARVSKTAAAIISSVVISPLIIPTIALGVSLYPIFAMWGLLGTRGGLAVAHAIGGIGYVFVIMRAQMAGFDFSLERASRSLGANGFRTFTRITVPILKPSLIAGTLFAFIHSFDELIISLFVSGSRLQPLPLKMWENVRNEIDPTIAAVSCLLLAIPLIALVTGAASRGALRR